MKTLKLIGLCLLMSAAASAQTEPAPAPAGDSDGDYHAVEIGARYMPTFSTFDVRTIDNGVVAGSFTLGHGFGGIVAVNFSRNVGVQGEFIYNELTQKYRDRDRDHKITLNYVNIPLLLSLNTGKGSAVNLNIVGGPQIGINVGSHVEHSGGGGVDTVQAVLAVKQGDLGLAYGAGLEFGLGPERNVLLDFGFRGVYGLIDISDRSRNITTNEYYILDRAHVQSYAGYVGLKFAF